MKRFTEAQRREFIANSERSAAGDPIDPRPIVKLFTPDAGATAHTTRQTRRCAADSRRSRPRAGGASDVHRLCRSMYVVSLRHPLHRRHVFHRPRNTGSARRAALVALSLWHRLPSEPRFNRYRRQGFAASPWTQRFDRLEYRICRREDGRSSLDARHGEGNWHRVGLAFRTRLPHCHPS